MANREPVGGFILAGGRSSRMSRPKGLLKLAGQPMVVHIAQVLESTGEAREAVRDGEAEVAAAMMKPVIIGPPDVYEGLGYRVVRDDDENMGPLGGISTALRIATCEWSLVVGCDLPFLRREWLEFLMARAKASTADVVIPLNERGFEPLCAMYRKRARAAIAEALDRGVRKVTDGLAGVALATIAPAEWKGFDACGQLFKNVNTPEDYDEARGSLREGTGS